MIKREIRFRAWLPAIEAMGMVVNLNGSNRTDYDENMWSSIQAECHVNGVQQFYSTSEFILMQATGVKDKNNAPIYEGDICRIHYYHDPNEPHVIGVVEWIDTGFSIKGVKNLNDQQITSVYSLRFKSGGNYGDYPAVEVIGNIHQHKHLLS